MKRSLVLLMLPFFWLSVPVNAADQADHPSMKEGLAAYKARDFAQARIKFRAACDDKNGLGCLSYADLLHFGKGGDEDLKLARLVYAKACSLNSQMGCTRLGIFMYFGQGGDKDPVIARKLFTTLCDKANSSESCAYLGTMMTRGDGGSMDTAGGNQRLAKACAGGFTQACKK